MLAIELVTGPDIEPVSLAEIRRHMREFDDVTENDADFQGYVTAGREWVENYTQRVLIEQTFRLTVGDDIACAFGDTVGSCVPVLLPYASQAWAQWMRNRQIMLHRSPALSIVSFVSVDAAGTETTIDASTYQLREADSKWPRIVPLNGATWGFGLYRVTFRAGFADRTGSPQQDASVVPERYKQAIKLYAEALYDRDPVMMQKLMDTAESLIKPERTALQFA